MERGTVQQYRRRLQRTYTEHDNQDLHPKGVLELGRGVRHPQPGGDAGFLSPDPTLLIS